MPAWSSLLIRLQKSSGGLLYTSSAMLLQKFNLFEHFLNFFAFGCKISMIIYDLSKQNCQMLDTSFFSRNIVQ
jgi:hypothetical protein